MKNKEEILSGLNQFYGTENYFRISNCLVLTDGTKYLCETAEMFWFADIVSSVISTMPKINRESFLVAKLFVKDRTAVFTLEDGNYGKLYTQKIEFTDCPLDKVEVFVEDSGSGFKVMLLPSEH